MFITMKKNSVVRLLIVVAAVVGICIAVYFGAPLVIRICLYLFSLLSPFIFGFAMSRLINPMADRLQRNLKIPRMASAVAMTLLIVGVLASIIGVIGYQIVQELKNFYNNSEEILATAQNAWNMLSTHYMELHGQLPESVRTMMDNIEISASEKFSDLVANMKIVDNAQAFAKALPGGIIWTVIFTLSMFFMVSNKDEMNSFFYRTLGERRINKLREIKQECYTSLGGYARAQVILMFIIFVLISVMLSIFGAPYSVLVAAITAFLDAMPVFGSGITLWPLALIYFINGDVGLGIGYVVVYLAVVLLRRMLEPKLVSDKLGFNPIITLLSMYIGYKWWGMIGMLIGPILLIMLMSLYRVGLFRGLIRAVKQLIRYAIRQIKDFAQYLNDITKQD